LGLLFIALIRFFVFQFSALRKTHFEHIANPEQFKNKLLQWSQQFDELLWLDSNDYKHSYPSYDAVLAAEAFTVLQTDSHNAFEQLKDYQTLTKDWIFGYLSYDLKNDVERLSSQNHDGLTFPELFFFQPKKLFLLKGNALEIQYLNLVSDEITQDLEQILAMESQGFDKTEMPSEVMPITIKPRISKDAYLEKATQMLTHIHRGNIYEANFCQEFYAEGSKIQAFEIFKKLNAISKPPFACYLKNHDQFLLSASPERYLKKEGDRIISQPIKGTAKRASNPSEDELLKQKLSEDQKERSENIMIVDLVRNDLSKTAKKGSVNVEELCKIHSFEQVHQMISTVTSTVKASVHPVDILKTTFPMGSMTGAPKISAMQLIEEFEASKRGLYSGAVGYFSPENDFDFNVVIRSILYNETKQYVSYSVGSAITSKSEPLKEYEECMLKAKAMREVLES
jgi:para-aminobenzoate synthetase component 1